MWTRWTRQLLQINKMDKMDHYSYYNYYLNICADLGCIYEYVCMYACIYIYTDIWHMSIHMGSGQDGLCTSFKDDHRSNGHSEHVEATNLISIGGYPKNVGHKKIYMYWMYIYIYFMNMSNLFPTHTHLCTCIHDRISFF